MHKLKDWQLLMLAVLFVLAIGACLLLVM